MPKAPTFRERIMAVLAQAPAASHELAATLGVDEKLTRATLYNLISDGFVTNSGKALPHEGRGRPSVLYQLTGRAPADLPLPRRAKRALRERIMDQLMDAPSTINEIALQIGVELERVRGVFFDLVSEGLIERAGERLTRAWSSKAVDTQQVYRMTRTKRSEPAARSAA